MHLGILSFAINSAGVLRSNSYALSRRIKETNLLFSFSSYVNKRSPISINRLIIFRQNDTYVKADDSYHSNYYYHSQYSQTMASMNFSSAKQTIKPPQRGIFPLDHDAECKPFKEKYLECLKGEGDKHHLCRDFSKDYLQCRMDRNLMASEDLDRVRHI